ncbi:helix-turn-helix transcriptional regulator [Rathayibacter sp. VKM Ac-2754]|uniref:helix-turn-helix transcriptional regulator n=1 Tax=Rathayibacter sp. VKM Ac-2754 TaxID=2609251 RepID=UPI00135ABBF9|nr:WYL domain-containing protein [Rathayibacter sp. VKM Ac-2754]MWV59714.1 WYL domain-containing protein [Rathayibacter sp. VKM Ac-2754]
MSQTTSRVLALLDLLQTHQQWSGPVLAARLGVTERTLRRDVERLRELGYAVVAARGATGGYRLEAGTRVPPLLLTDDEAVTVAVGLRLAADEGLEDGARTTLSALAKFEQVLPSALRERVNAVSRLQRWRLPREAAVPQELLGRLALACRDQERIRFHYTAADGAESDRLVDPHAVVSTRRTWVLIGWDLRREGWRTFRLDRTRRLTGTRVRFEARIGPDAVADTAGRGEFRLDVLLPLPLGEATALLGRWSAGAVAEGERLTRWPIDAETSEGLLSALVWIPAHVGFRLEGSPETISVVATALERLREAVASAGDGQ